MDALASAFLHSGPFLNADTRKYLDNAGNQNNAYDLGDLRAYVLRNPNLQGLSDLSALIELTVPMGDIKNQPGGGTIKREDRP